MYSQHEALWGIKDRLVAKAAEERGLRAEPVGPGWLWLLFHPKQEPAVGIVEYRLDAAYRRWECADLGDDSMPDAVAATAHRYDHAAEAVARFA